jgi:hypothetical protein
VIDRPITREAGSTSAPEAPVVRLFGSPGDQGLQHAAFLGSILSEAARRDYLVATSLLTGVSPGMVRAGAAAWLESLPAHIQVEIDAMALGASRAEGFSGPALSTLDVAEWLYADIASGEGAACSAITVEIDRAAWVARNCDWLPSQLLRGHSVVIHDHPRGSSRIPTLAMGIAGDIDVDTGMNAAGLWLHVHTMHAKDVPRPTRPRLSWLFWAREALETCESLDDLDAMLSRVDRDRGTILVAIDAKTNERAVFECARGSHERHDAGLSFQCATNHPARKQPLDPERLARSRPGGTIRRRDSIERLALANHEWSPPDDLAAILAHPSVEMRDAKHLRTIYSAICRPGSRDLWFCSGSPSANSSVPPGRWTRVSIPWTKDA